MKKFWKFIKKLFRRIGKDVVLIRDTLDHVIDIHVQLIDAKILIKKCIAEFGESENFTRLIEINSNIDKNIGEIKENIKKL